nr:hypothetical protein [Euryhalocaulis caribicus]
MFLVPALSWRGKIERQLKIPVAVAIKELNDWLTAKPRLGNPRLFRKSFQLAIFFR